MHNHIISGVFASVCVLDLGPGTNLCLLDSVIHTLCLQLTLPPYSIIEQNCTCMDPNILNRVNVLTCRRAKAENNMGLIFSISREKFLKIM